MNIVSQVSIGEITKIYICNQISINLRHAIIKCIVQLNNTEITDVLLNSNIIICVNNYDFYKSVGIQMVNPIWAIQSVFSNCMLPLKFFSVNPNKFFSGKRILIVLDKNNLKDMCIAKVYSKLIKYYGGLVYIDNELKLISLFTHCICYNSKYPLIVEALNKYKYDGTNNSSNNIKNFNISDIDNFNNNELELFFCNYLNNTSLMRNEPILSSLKWLDKCFSSLKYISEDQEFNHLKSHKSSNDNDNDFININNDIDNINRKLIYFPIKKSSNYCNNIKNTNKVFESYKVIISPYILNEMSENIFEFVKIHGGTIINNDKNSIKLDNILNNSNYLIITDNLNCPIIKNIIDKGIIKNKMDIARGVNVFIFGEGVRITLVTSYYINYCLDIKCYCDSIYKSSIINSVLLSPLYHLSIDNSDISYMNGVVVSITGFIANNKLNHSIEKNNNCKNIIYSREFVKSSLTISGACYISSVVENLTTHLICQGNDSEKYIKSRKWGSIKIVNFNWLLDCISQQKKVLEDEYLIDKQYIKEKEIFAINEDNNISNIINHSSSQYDFYSTQLSIFSQSPTINVKSKNLNIKNESMILDGTNNIEESPISINNVIPSSLSPQQLNPLSQQSNLSPILLSPQLNDTLISKQSNLSSMCKKPSFIFGGGLKSEHKIYKQIIEELGGIVIWPVVPNYDNNCTHLILFELKRTEKFLCCCSEKKWILNTTYLDECKRIGKFILEEKYEINGIDNISKAGKRWRISINKPFDNMNICIIGNCSPPSDTLKKVINCGNGIVTLIPIIFELENELNNYQSALTKCNLVVIDKTSIIPEFISKYISNCINKSVSIVSPMYLIDIITKSEFPDSTSNQYRVDLCNEENLSSTKNDNNKRLRDEL